MLLAPPQATRRAYLPVLVALGLHATSASGSAPLTVECEVTATLQIAHSHAALALLQRAQVRKSSKAKHVQNMSTAGDRGKHPLPLASRRAGLALGKPIILWAKPMAASTQAAMIDDEAKSSTQQLVSHYGVFRASWTFACLVLVFVVFLTVSKTGWVVYSKTTSGLPSSLQDQRLPAWVAKADAIFAACDRDKDGHLAFEEFEWLAVRNGRHHSRESYRELCRLLGASSECGLTVQEFRQSYALLGHDVDYDLAVLQRALRKGCGPSHSVVVDATPGMKEHATCRLSLGSPGFASRLDAEGAGYTGHLISMLRALSARITLR